MVHNQPSRLSHYIHVTSHCFITFDYVLTNQKTKIVSEYDQKIPQSQTADNPIAPRGRAPRPSRDTRTPLSKATSSLFPIKVTFHKLF